MEKPTRQTRETESRKRDVIVAHIRERIVSGAWRPGMKLPPRTRFAADFTAAPLTVQRAFRILLDDGILEAKERIGTRVAPRLPHLSRFAMLLYGTEQDVGHHTRALLMAAESLRKRGYEIDCYFVLDLPLDIPENHELLRKLRSNCYAGVFWEAVSRHHLDLFPQFELPMTGFWGPGDSTLPQHLPPLRKEPDVWKLESQLRHLAERGVRRVAFLETRAELLPERAEDFRKLAAAYKLECPAGAFLVLPHEMRKHHFAEEPLALLFSPHNAERPDGLILRNETFLAPLEKILRHFYGDAARDVLKVISVCNYPALPDSGLDVSYYGVDMARTLENGLDALAELRRGGRPQQPKVFFYEDTPTYKE